MTVRVLCGDARDVLRTLPDASVHCCVTSPPYYGLRDYGVPGQMGLEATPEEWVQVMVGVFREVRRVLRPDGTLWLNIGDSYAGSGKGPSSSLSGLMGAQQPHSHGVRIGSIHGDSGHTSGVTPPPGYKAKDLYGIPWMLAFALRADGWYLRADIIWAKPNPMPESVQDRPTKAHEYLFLLSKSRTYYYDADAIREAPTGRTDTMHFWKRGMEQSAEGQRQDAFRTRDLDGDVGRNKRSVWTVATEAFPESHFATYPTALIEPCIKAGTSEKGCCPECGAPWVREVDVSYTDAHRGMVGNQRKQISDEHVMHAGREFDKRLDKHSTTVGWRPSCGHAGDPVPATVCDPFFGAGTTGLVADRLNRDCIGIEINPQYAQMARRRITGDNPLFTEVEVA